MASLYTVSRPRLVPRALLALALAFSAAAGSAGIALAQPAGSHIIVTRHDGDRQYTLAVHSASMNRTLPVQVIRAADTSVPRPTVYLLGDLWLDKTDVADFYRDKNVNVVIPIGGAYTYYTDWRADDPVLGSNKWTTYLTQELPPLIDAELGANGNNAIAGISMAATSVLSLAIAAPQRYQAVGSFSGCAQTSDPLGQAFVRALVEGRGRGNTTNMWGPPNDPAWAANDPFLHAEKLRGTEIFIANGSGMPGPHDTLESQDIEGDPIKLIDRYAVGGLLEASTNMCTQRLTAKLTALGIRHEFKFRMDRTHAWAYWQEDLHDSWPLFARALGV